jgi:hypothetical protein
MGGINSIPIAHLPLGRIDALEHVSLEIVNGPLGVGVLPITTVAVLLRLIIVISFCTPVDPAATGAKTTDLGALSETVVPLPNRPTLAGAAPLYGTDSDPDEGVGAVGENCSIIVQLFLGRTV